MDPEATLTTILEAFYALSNSNCGIEKANQTDRDACKCSREIRDEARDALRALADWIDKGGYSPMFVRDGSGFVRQNVSDTVSTTREKARPYGSIYHYWRRPWTLKER